MECFLPLKKSLDPRHSPSSEDRRADDVEPCIAISVGHNLKRRVCLKANVAFILV